MRRTNLYKCLALSLAVSMAVPAVVYASPANGEEGQSAAAVIQETEAEIPAEPGQRPKRKRKPKAWCRLSQLPKYRQRERLKQSPWPRKRRRTAQARSPERRNSRVNRSRKIPRRTSSCPAHLLSAACRTYRRNPCRKKRLDSSYPFIRNTAKKPF